MIAIAVDDEALMLRVLVRAISASSDITEGGGVLLEVHQSSSSNQGAYHFGEIDFTFPTTNQEN